MPMDDLIETESATERVRRNGSGRPQTDYRERVLAWGLAALGSRALVFVTTASCLGMVWWTVTHPTPLTIIANAPSLLILAFVLWRDARVGG